MTDVLITVKSTQFLDDTENVIEFKTVGKFGIKNQKYYIRYQETEENGAKTDTLIKIDETSVIMNRSGAIENRMVIEVGKRNSCLYSTPMGRFIVDIYGQSINNELTNNGGNLTLNYALNINSAPIGNNQIEITVKEV